MARQEKGKYRYGWGAVYRDGRAYKVYRSLEPCWEDQNIFLVGKDSDMSTLHAEELSSGILEINNIQPLKVDHRGKDWYFCHDGTVWDNFERYRRKALTGTERYLSLLLDKFDEERDIASIGEAVSTLKSYSSLNSFLFDGKHLYVVNAHQKRPRHYTLNVLDRGDGIVISSEPLPGISKGWKPMKNRQIAKVTLKPLGIELS